MRGGVIGCAHSTWLVGVLACSLANAADAPRDAVVLSSGETLSGTIVRQVPGAYVVLRTASGGTEVVPWAQIARVSLSRESAAALEPAAPTASPTPRATAPKVDDERAPEAGARSDPPPAPSEPLLPPMHLEIGARLGVARPFGNVETNSDKPMSQQVEAAVPVTVEAGARFDGGVFVGGYASYAVTKVHSEETSSDAFCANGATSCAAHDVRYGVELIRYLEGERSTTWIGVGTGIEKISLSYDSATPTHHEFSASGWEVLHAQAGVAWPVGDLEVGPYALFSYCRYTSKESDGKSKDVDDDEKAAHQWLAVGVRGTFVKR